VRWRTQRAAIVGNLDPPVWQTVFGGSDKPASPQVGNDKPQPDALLFISALRFTRRTPEIVVRHRMRAGVPKTPLRAPRTSSFYLRFAPTQ